MAYIDIAKQFPGRDCKSVRQIYLGNFGGKGDEDKEGSDGEVREERGVGGMGRAGGTGRSDNGNLSKRSMVGK